MTPSRELQGQTRGRDRGYLCALRKGESDAGSAGTPEAIPPRIFARGPWRRGNHGWRRLASGPGRADRVSLGLDQEGGAAQANPRRQRGTLAAKWHVATRLDRGPR